MENIDCIQMAKTSSTESLLEQAVSIITKLTDDEKRVVLSKYAAKYGWPL